VIRVETSRITHFFDRSGEYEKLETLDGPKREIIRNNNEISPTTPTSCGQARESDPRKNFPALLPDQLSSLTEYYQLRKGEHERIAGYDSQASLLQPRRRVSLSATNCGWKPPAACCRRRAWSTRTIT
jgi:sigma-E factor negative regulatory protein RseB